MKRFCFSTFSLSLCFSFCCVVKFQRVWMFSFLRLSAVFCHQHAHSRECQAGRRGWGERSQMHFISAEQVHQMICPSNIFINGKSSCCFDVVHFIRIYIYVELISLRMRIIFRVLHCPHLRQCEREGRVGVDSREYFNLWLMNDMA